MWRREDWRRLERSLGITMNHWQGNGRGNVPFV
jgi:hypothetical protein